MEAAELVELLKQWVEVTEDLAQLVPAATPLELVEYARGVIGSPVSATVLASALQGLPAAEQPVPAATSQKKVFGVRR